MGGVIRMNYMSLTNSGYFVVIDLFLHSVRRDSSRSERDFSAEEFKMHHRLTISVIAPGALSR